MVWKAARRLQESLVLNLGVIIARDLKRVKRENKPEGRGTLVCSEVFGGMKATQSFQQIAMLPLMAFRGIFYFQT